MSQLNFPGFLLVVEGVDGAGKSTVVRKLAAYCEASGLDYIASREPTDGQWGKAVRQSALTGRLSLEEELELFLKDRREHVEKLIRPALAAGRVIILDRYYLSTAAYQGARGADPEKILAENEHFAPAPDLALLLDLPPVDGLIRVKTRGDVPNEFEREQTLTEVRRIFLSIDRPWIARVNAGRDPEEVAGECIAKFERAREAKMEGLGESQ